MTEPNEPEDVHIPSYEELLEGRNRPRNLYHAQKMAVLAGEITPLEAEGNLRQQGLPIFYEETQDTSNATESSVWPLPLFIIFLAYRDLEHARKQWERFKVWGPHIQRDPCVLPQLGSFDSVLSSVLPDLRAGVFRAIGDNYDGFTRTISYEEWDLLSFGPDWETLIYASGGRVAYRGVSFLRHEVVPFFILENGTNSQVSKPQQRERGDQPAQRRGGGRPPLYDWDAMWIEVVRLATEDKITDRSALSAHLLAWFVDKTGTEPGETIFKEKMAKLFKTLGWDL